MAKNSNVLKCGSFIVLLQFKQVVIFKTSSLFDLIILSTEFPDQYRAQGPQSKLSSGPDVYSGPAGRAGNPNISRHACTLRL